MWKIRIRRRGRKSFILCCVLNDVQQFINQLFTANDRGGYKIFTKMSEWMNKTWAIQAQGPKKREKRTFHRLVCMRWELSWDFFFMIQLISLGRRKIFHNFASTKYKISSRLFKPENDWRNSSWRKKTSQSRELLPVFEEGRILEKQRRAMNLFLVSSFSSFLYGNILAVKKLWKRKVGAEWECKLLLECVIFSSTSTSR